MLKQIAHAARGRLAIIVISALCAVFSSALAALTLSFWTNGYPLLTIAIGVVWLYGASPWLLLFVFVLFDLVFYASEGKVAAVRAVIELTERRKQRREESKAEVDGSQLGPKGVLHTVAFLCNPLSPPTLVLAALVSVLPAHTEAVRTMIRRAESTKTLGPLDELETRWHREVEPFVRSYAL